MMHIKLIAVGSLKERFWRDACDEYLKRLQAYAQVKVIEVRDIDPDVAGGTNAALDKEAEAILKTISSDDYVILMDVADKMRSSEQIAESLGTLSVEGKNDIVFVVGSSSGVGNVVRKRADAKWSFGAITMPHNLFRVVLLEQIYRAFKISRNEPYHK